MPDMSILNRFANRVWGRHLARDLEDEVTFHIDMRTTENLRTGVSLEKATTDARKQFGDVEAVMANMRKARVTSTMFLTMTAVLIAGVVSWHTQQQAAITHPTLPPVRAVSIFIDPNLQKRSPPPRPPAPPTWSQFVKQTKAFEVLQSGP